MLKDDFPIGCVVELIEEAPWSAHMNVHKGDIGIVVEVREQKGYNDLVYVAINGHSSLQIYPHRLEKRSVVATSEEYEIVL